MLQPVGTKPAAALASWNETASIRSAQPLLFRVLQQLDRPVLVIASDGRLVYSNDCGTEFLGAGVLLRVTDGRVVASDPDHQKPWRLGLEKCRHGSRHLIFLGHGPAGRAICAGPMEASEGDETLILAIVGGASTSSGYPLAEFGRHFGLTAGEILVLRQLLANRKPADIARDTRRSVATVRAHVRNLLAKTDCSSMSDLLLHVTRLPPVRTGASSPMRAAAGRSFDLPIATITTQPAAAWQ